LRARRPDDVLRRYGVGWQRKHLDPSQVHFRHRSKGTSAEFAFDDALLLSVAVLPLPTAFEYLRISGPSYELNDLAFVLEVCTAEDLEGTAHETVFIFIFILVFLLDVCIALGTDGRSTNRRLSMLDNGSHKRFITLRWQWDVLRLLLTILSIRWCRYLLYRCRQLFFVLRMCRGCSFSHRLALVVVRPSTDVGLIFVIVVVFFFSLYRLTEDAAQRPSSCVASFPRVSPC
ncbi:hypothetical protein KCU81_g65, partial [Aureobasidium melanogenum]